MRSVNCGRTVNNTCHIVPWSRDETRRLDPSNGVCLNALNISKVGGRYAILAQIAGFEIEANLEGGNVDAARQREARIQAYNALRRIATGDGKYGDAAVPASLALISAIPNPFNSSTRIHLTVPEWRNVSLGIYDLSGRELTRLVDSGSAQTSEVTWKATGFPAGIYFACMNIPTKAGVGIQ